MDLSNFLTLTADNKKTTIASAIWRHLKTFWILYRQIEFVFVLSTSNCHHVNPPVSAVVKCKMVDLDYYGLKVKMFMALLRTLFPRNLYSNIPVAEVSCVCSDIFAWCPLVTVNVDSNHPTKYPHVCEMETIKFSLESPSAVSTPHWPKLETYGICEAMCFARAYRWLQ